MKRTVIIDALKSEALGQPIHVCGWVRSRRGNKNVSFIALNDGSTIKNIQIVADLSKFSEEVFGMFVVDRERKELPVFSLSQG